MRHFRSSLIRSSNQFFGVPRIATLIVSSCISLSVHAQPEPPHVEAQQPSAIILSITDNSDQSPLDASHVLAVVAEPELDPELYALLGTPISARKTFLSDPDTEFLEDDFAKLVETSRHYVTLQYQEGSELAEIESILRSDDRFAFVGIDRIGTFSSVSPTDPFFAYPTFYPFNYLNTDYQWASDYHAMNLPFAWGYNTGWASIGVIDGGVGTIDEELPNPTGVHGDLQNVTTYNHSWNFTCNKRKFDSAYYCGNFVHGTHVLGLIAANANNGYGGTGVCWNCSANYRESLFF